jgi:uncharacterized membrane protein YqjE
VDALGRLLVAVLAVVETRGRLLVAELEEERAAMEVRLLLAVIAAAAAGFALLLFTLLAVVAFWDTHRLEAIAVAGAVYLALALWAGWRARAIGLEKPAPFAASLGELAKDRAAIREGKLARRVAEITGDAA